MSKFNQLLSILNKEFSVQQDLHQVLKTECEAIKKFDQGELDKTCQKKTLIVENAEALEAKRNTLIKQIVEPGETQQIKSLKDIIEKCKDPQLRKSLSYLRDKLRAIVTEVQGLNLENQRLLKESVALVATSASLFQNVVHESISTYSAHGTVKDHGAQSYACGKTRGHL